MERYEQAVRQWQDWNVQTVADIDQYLDNFRILFAYHSGKIENAEITYHKSGFIRLFEQDAPEYCRRY